MAGSSIKLTFTVWIETASRYYRYLAYISMALMAIIVSIDVLGRFLLNKPLLGGPEIVEELMVCVIFFMFPYVTGVDRHIKVDVIVDQMKRFTPRLQWFLEVAFDLLMFVMLAFLTWEGFWGVIGAYHSGEVTDNLAIPHYPFRFVLAVGFFLGFFTFLLRFVQGINAKMRGT